MLSPQTIEELRRERSILLKAREQLKAKIVALEAILGSERTVVLQDVESNGTLAAKIRAALASVGGAANAKTVTGILEDQGVTAKGKSTLLGIVSAELVRMARTEMGGVKWVSRGRYEIKDE